MSKIRKVQAVVDVSTADTTAVDISASLPDLNEPGEAVSFAFSGAQDAAFFLGNEAKTLYVQLCDSGQRIDFGPFDADWLRSSGQTYLWADGAASAGAMSVLLVDAR